MAHPHPFYAGTYGECQLYHVTADDRIQVAKKFNREQCIAALGMPDLQKTVERAIQVRLRHLEREAHRKS